MNELIPTTEIYSPVWGTHLGDCIGTINYFLHESYLLNQRVRFSDHYVRLDANGNIGKRKYCWNLHEMMGVVDDADSERISLIKDDPTFFHWQYGLDAYLKHKNKPFLRNKYQFSKQNIGTNVLAYQFDARGKRSLIRNFPSKDIEDLVIKELENMGFQLIRLGVPLTLQQCSEVLSKAEALVCVMSGMAWLAGTTRTPVFFVGNGRTQDALTMVNGYHTSLWSQDYRELLDNVRKYKDDRCFYDDNCTKG